MGGGVGGPMKEKEMETETKLSKDDMDFQSIYLGSI